MILTCAVLSFATVDLCLQYKNAKKTTFTSNCHRFLRSESIWALVAYMTSYYTGESKNDRDEDVSFLVYDALSAGKY